jgi:hypothetical protein
MRLDHVAVIFNLVDQKNNNDDKQPGDDAQQ